MAVMTRKIQKQAGVNSLSPPTLQGFVPFFVSATAGTTVYGAFDPLIAISDVCKKYNIWMHVDVSKDVVGFKL